MASVESAETDGFRRDGGDSPYYYFPHTGYVCHFRLLCCTDTGGERLKWTEGQGQAVAMVHLYAADNPPAERKE